MQSKDSRSRATNISNKKTYEVKFIDGTIDMKILLKELIACRVGRIMNIKVLLDD